MKKIKTTFTAVVALFAVFAMAIAMLVFPAKGNKAVADESKVQATDLFYFTDGDVAQTGYIKRATGLHSDYTDGSLAHATNGNFGYDDFTNKGVYVDLWKSNDASGAPASDGAGGFNKNNVLRTRVFSLADNTKNDVLFAYKGMDNRGSSYKALSENGTKTAAQLLQSSKLPYHRDQYLKIVDANDPNHWLRLHFDYRDSSGGADASYGYANLLLNGGASNLKVQRGGAVLTSSSSAKGNAIIPDVAWGKYNTVNRVYYDATENALYADIADVNHEQAVTQKALIRDFNDGVYGDSYDFNFENVYLEFYFVAGPGENEYIFTDLDGVNLATDAEGYILDQNTVLTYNENPDTYVTDTLSFTSIQGVPGEYALPTIARKNMLGAVKEDIVLNKQYNVTAVDGLGNDVTYEVITGLNDGKWTPNAKLNAPKPGNYTVTYQRGAKTYTLTAFIAEYVSTNEFITVSEGIDMSYNALAPEFMRTGECSREGLGFKWGLGNGGSISVNKVYDVDILDENLPIVELAVTPKVKAPVYDDQTPESAIEFEKLNVKLVDAEDPSIYVDYIINGTRFGSSLSFASVAANGQDYANNKVLNGNYSFGKLGSNNGVTVKMTFTGQTNATAKVYFDHATNRAIIGPSTYSAAPWGLANNKYVLRDLDSEDHLTGSDALFGGFPSGKFKIVISVPGAYRDDASFILYSVMGQRVGAETVEDVTAPVLYDVDNFNGVMPKAQRGVKFPFPKVKAYDIMDGDITDKIIGSLVDPDGNPVEISGDGFVPTKLGKYVYTVKAADAVSNVATTTFDINVIEKLQNVYIALDNPYVTTAKVGESVKLSSYKVGGGSGNISSEVSVTAPDGTAVDISTSTINFTTQGLYTIQYKVTDYIGVKYFKYFVSVAYSDTPVISEVNVPKAILAGKTVTFPKPVAYDYYSYIGEQKEANVEVYVKEPGKEAVKLGSDLKFTPTVESGEIEVSYRARALLDSSKVSDPDTYKVKVIKPVTLADYFLISDGVDVVFEKPDGFTEEVIFNTVDNGETISFINPLPAIGFTATVVGIGANSMSDIDITLTDIVNPDEKIVINVKTESGVSTTTVCGEESKLTGGSFTSRGYTLSLKSGYKFYDNANTYIATARETIYGEAFNGFSSGKVYMDITINDVGDAGAKFAIRSLVNQARFTKSLRDNTAPFISMASEYTLYNKFGSEITLAKATAADILDPNSVVTITVVDPDGNTLIDNKSAGDNHVIKLDKYGTYKLTYSAKDATGNLMQAPYNLVSHDDVKPTIEVKGNIRTVYKVGDKFVLNEMKASDNVTASEDMVMYVMITEHFTSIVNTYICSEYGVKNEATGKTPEFTFKNVGTYSVRIFVRDGSYNFSAVDYTVTVTE